VKYELPYLQVYEHKRKNGKVWITGTDNNVFVINPLTGKEFREFRKWEWEYGNRILREQGRTALEEVIALNVLDGKFKFYSGNFYWWMHWFWDKVDTDSLQKKVNYIYDDELGVNKDEWNLNVERLRKELWEEFYRKPSE
jgi:hypothetical protein